MQGNNYIINIVIIILWIAIYINNVAAPHVFRRNVKFPFRVYVSASVCACSRVHDYFPYIYVCVRMCFFFP